MKFTNRLWWPNVIKCSRDQCGPLSVSHMTTVHPQNGSSAALSSKKKRVFSLWLGPGCSANSAGKTRLLAQSLPVRSVGSLGKKISVSEQNDVGHQAGSPYYDRNFGHWRPLWLKGITPRDLFFLQKRPNSRHPRAIRGFFSVVAVIWHKKVMGKLGRFEATWTRFSLYKLIILTLQNSQFSNLPVKSSSANSIFQKVCTKQVCPSWC